MISELNLQSNFYCLFCTSFCFILLSVPCIMLTLLIHYFFTHISDNACQNIRHKQKRYRSVSNFCNVIRSRILCLWTPYTLLVYFMPVGKLSILLFSLELRSLCENLPYCLFIRRYLLWKFYETYLLVKGVCVWASL